MDPTQDMEAPSPRRPHRARFLPGTILEGRFRIVAPLGRGGMGEVYRADDMKLGAPVALKFLSTHVEQSASRLAALLDEVKLARHVSHPNVCRVWDVGESDGLHFVAMEYVDGEDLRSLLRRIGRLPEDRGVQIARELCAGLAAIHDQGVLHRDLKPANVMIDGRGRVRIADFGLATLAGAVEGDAARSGTPAYMAPEQSEGREVTVRSDIYALGLVLYEVFTGHHAYDSGTSSRTSDTRVTTPVTHVRTLDPLIESAILRCLERDPALRPPSALAVASAFPGGDPVMAALMAGETPSPQMVAASGGVGGLRPLAATGIVACIALAFVASLVLSEARGLPFEPGDKPFIALRDRANDFVQSLGAAQAGENIAEGFTRWSAATDAPATRANHRDVFYWYRRSPRPVVVTFEERNQGAVGSFCVPDVETPGELALRLDLRGRLLEFRCIPSPKDSLLAAPDWRPFFAAAGLDDAHAVPAPPHVLPMVPTDQRVAWTVTSPGGSQHVEGGAFGGHVTLFVVGEPFTVPPPTRGALIGSTIGSLFFVAIFFCMLVLARRNIRAGRADMRGAMLLAILTLAVGYFGWGMLAAPNITWPGGTLLVYGVGVTVFYALLQGGAYLALEPFARRQHPEWLASWSRALDGRLLDRLVGRDVLGGVLGGVLAVAVTEASGALRHTFPAGDYQAAAVGGHVAVAVIIRSLTVGINLPMILILLLSLIERVSRKRWIGWVLWFTLAPILASGSLTRGWTGLPFLIVLAVVLLRFGLLGMVTCGVVYVMINDEYLTMHLSAWYASVTVAALFTIGAIVTWATIAATRAPRGVRRS